MAKKKNKTKAKKKAGSKKSSESEDDSFGHKKDKVQLRNTILFLTLVVLIVAVIAIPRLFPEPTRKIISLGGDDYDTSSYEYNSFFFTYKDGAWFSAVQTGNTIYDIAYRYGPRDLEDVKVLGDIERVRYAKYVYITLDIEDGDKWTTFANAEVAINLARHFNNEIRAACTTDHPDCEGVPVKNCNNTDEPIIYYRVAPGPLIEEKDNCIIIQGEGEDIVKAADRFMYMMYGIM
jgi:hypothetical protein